MQQQITSYVDLIRDLSHYVLLIHYMIFIGQMTFNKAC